ncbi:MAG: glycosyl hydrolase 53 family protein [Bacteroidales bacterium]|nr:glycosyl hydrolase 53 family protein [Bacteroidales bacterium]
MKKLSFLMVILIFALASCKKNNNVSPSNPNSGNPTQQQPMTLRGADLSYLPEIEQAGTIFYDSTGAATDPLTIFKNNGCNTVRLRLWYQPATVHSSFPEVLAFANTIHQAGMKVWLDIQYSDTWTDQGNQAKPASWANLSTQVLEDSVYQYTKRVVAAIQPEYVQIGNEINDGFLWNNGKVNNTSTFIALLDKGIQAAKTADGSTQVIIHFAGYKSAFWFYRLLQSNNVNYDIIGISYYPWWHGKDLNVMEDSLSRLSSTFNKKIVIAETAYPFTLGWNDLTNNVVGESSQLISQYPATPDGQKNYLLALRNVLSKDTNNLGFCYWEPDWVAFKGPQATNGSTWENLALFDFNNKALPGMAVFNK